MPRISLVAGGAILLLALLTSAVSISGAVAQVATDGQVGQPLQLVQLASTHRIAVRPKLHNRALAHRIAARPKPHDRKLAKRAAKTHLALTRHRSVRSTAMAHTHRGLPAHGVFVARVRRPAPPLHTDVATATLPQAAAPALAAAPQAATPQAVAPVPPEAPGTFAAGDHAVRVTSAENGIDLAESDPEAPVDAVVPATSAGGTGADTTAGTTTAAKSPTATNDAAEPERSPDTVAAFVAQPRNEVGSTAWILQVMAALGGAVAAGSVAWLLTGSAPQRTFG